MTGNHPEPRRIAVFHQGCVPVYRRGFFEHLSRMSANRYTVFHGAPPSNISLQAAKPPFAFENVELNNRELKIGGSIAVWQPAVWRYLTGGYDGLIVGHEFKFLSSLVMVACSRVLRRPVIWWGFGYRKAYGSWQGGGGPGLKDRLAIWAADRLARFGDGYLAYTEKGRDHLLSIGMAEDRIQVVRNTIDVEEQVKLAQAVADMPDREIRAEFGLKPDSTVFLYVGRLVPRKRVDMLIDFAKRFPDVGGKPVEVLVVGDGEEMPKLREQASGTNNVHFTGAIDPSDVRIAKAMKVACAVVIPGYLGLAINHAFAHARPVVTQKHDFHSPEIEYLTEGYDALLIGGDEEAFCEGLAAFAASPDEQARLAANAGKTRESLRIGQMVEAFDGFVSRIVPAPGGAR